MAAGRARPSPTARRPRPTRPRRAVAEVGVLEVHEVPLVEPADGVERLPPQQHAGAGQPADRPLDRVALLAAVGWRSTGSSATSTRTARARSPFPATAAHGPTGRAARRPCGSAAQHPGLRPSAATVSSSSTAPARTRCRGWRRGPTPRSPPATPRFAAPPYPRLRPGIDDRHSRLRSELHLSVGRPVVDDRRQARARRRQDQRPEERREVSPGSTSRRRPGHEAPYQRLRSPSGRREVDVAMRRGRASQVYAAARATPAAAEPLAQVGVVQQRRRARRRYRRRPGVRAYQTASPPTSGSDSRRRRQHRRPARHRLEHRQPEPLAERRVGDDLGPTEEARNHPVGDEPGSQHGQPVGYGGDGRVDRRRPIPCRRRGRAPAGRPVADTPGQKARTSAGTFLRGSRVPRKAT